MVFVRETIEINTSISIDINYAIYLVHALSTNIILTLPLITCDGITFTIRNLYDSTESIIVNTTGGNLINGISSITIDPYCEAVIHSSNNSWYTVNCSNDKRSTFDISGGTGPMKGNLVTFDANKNVDNAVHKLLCEKWEWTARIDGVNNEQYPKIIADGCGAFIISYTNSSTLPTFWNYDGTTGATGLNGITPTNNYVTIGKIDAEGQWQFNNLIDGISDEILPDIASDDNSNLYVTAQCIGYTGPNYYNVDGTIEITGDSSINQVIIGKLTFQGIWQWATNITGIGSNSQPKISADTCDDIFIVGVGMSGSTGVFNDPDQNSIIKAPFDHNYIYVAKYNANGQIISVNTVSGNMDNSFPNVKVDDTGCVFVLGICNIGGAPQFNNINNSFVNGSIESTKQLWIGKLCCDGQWDWNTRISSVLGNMRPIISTDLYSNLYVGFKCDSITPPIFYNSDGDDPFTYNSTYNDQLVVGKIDKNGFWFWTLLISDNLNGIYIKEINSIDVDGRGNIYISGHSNTPLLIFYNTDGTIGGSLSHTTSDMYAWLAKYNTHGNLEWVVKINSNSDDILPSVSLDKNGNVYFAGQGANGSTLTFNNPSPSNGIASITLAGGTNDEIFIGKIVSEDMSSKLVGVIKDVISPTDVLVQFTGNIRFPGNTFIPGDKYFYDCSTKTITNKCYDVTHEFRYIGIACNIDTILWAPNNIVCVPKRRTCKKINCSIMGNNNFIINQNDITINNNLVVNGTISALNFITMSDERIKENITDANLNETLQNISQLKLKKYNYTESFQNSMNQQCDYQPKYGLIAQQVNNIIPEAITIGTYEVSKKITHEQNMETKIQLEDFHFINKDQIIMQMLGAIQALNNKIIQLEYKLDDNI